MRSSAGSRQLLRLTAERDQLVRQLEQLQHVVVCLRAERDAARTEVMDLRRQFNHCEHQLAETRASLASLAHAVQHADERLKALLRRQFGRASERLFSEEHMIPEILEFIRTERAAREGNVTDPTSAQASSSDSDTTNDNTGDSNSNNASDAPAASSTGSAQRPTGRRRPATAGGRHALPDDIERRHVTYQPAADHPALRHVRGAEIIGQSTHERWCIGPMDVYIEVMTCPVARIVGPTGLTRQETLTPPSVIPRSQVSDAMLVATAVDRIVDHLPNYRQEQRFARFDVHIPRSKLCRWHIDLAHYLQPLDDAILDVILAEPVIGIDDSVRRLLVDGRHTCQHGRLWAVAGTSGVHYFFTDTRGGKWIADVLQGYSGAVMGDAYSGHNQLLARDDILALFCWAHVRRKFYDAADRARRDAMLFLISQLYGIENDLTHSTPVDRRAVRQQRAIPILHQIKTLMEHWHADPAVLPQSGIGKACAYALKRWDGLMRYCDIGAAPIDNNHTERCMRPGALDRKNSLFSASVAGAKAYATLLSLTQSAHLHDLNPVTYLNDVIEIMHYDRRPVSELIPSVYGHSAPLPSVQLAQCGMPVQV